MDNTVTQEVFKRIDVLAEKLGVTAKYLWPKLVSLEFARAISTLLFLFVPVVFGAIMHHFYKKYKPGTAGEPNINGVWAMITGIATAISLIGAIVILIDSIPNMISPEAAAFYRLFGR